MKHALLSILVVLLSAVTYGQTAEYRIEGKVKNCTSQVSTPVAAAITDGDSYVDVTVFNFDADTIYLFSTYLADSLITLEGLTEKRSTEIVTIDLREEYPIKGGYFSGITQAQFLAIAPREACGFRIAKYRLLETVAKRKQVRALQLNLKLTWHRQSDIAKQAQGGDKYFLDLDVRKRQLLTGSGIVNW